MERRTFLKLSGTAGVVAALPSALLASPAQAATQLSGATYAAASKFTLPLPRPPRVNLNGFQTSVVMDVAQFQQQVLTGYPATTLYGYALPGRQPTWPGPTMIASSERTVHATFRNKLPAGTLTLADGGHLLPVDPSLLDAAMLALPAGQIPAVTHLHGGHTEWESDGYPEAWETQDGHKGEYWRKSTYTFDNSQVGGNLWYHDHALGITRLNVYAGLSGMYWLRDVREYLLMAADVLPSGPYENELVVQDRWFTDDGQLYMQTTPSPEDGIVTSIICDFVLTNGAAWPVMDVEPRKYRFRLLNASDGRMYVLQLDSGGSILVVGTDLGLLPQATAVDRLLIAPGERYDIVLDFTGLAQGTEVTLTNQGVDGVLVGFGTGTPTGPGGPPGSGGPGPGGPFAGVTVTNNPNDPALGFGGPADPGSTGLITKFRVSQPLSRVPNARVQAGTRLGGALPALTATRTRGVMTFFGRDGLGRGMEMLGSLDGGTAMWPDPVTETVTEGTTEIWEVYNTGPIAHPIHLHLVNFQVLDRAPFTFTSEPMTMSDGGTGAMITITGTGTARPPEPYELGRKDTVVCYPGEVTRVIANFDRAGNYVWHCHILHHEDHMMMRPLVVS